MDATVTWAMSFVEAFSDSRSSTKPKLTTKHKDPPVYHGDLKATVHHHLVHVYFSPSASPDSRQQALTIALMAPEFHRR